MKYYKLTKADGRTANDTVWGIGVTHKAKGNGKTLCSSDVIHVYDHPLKAAMFNPIHANFRKPKLWECHMRGVVADDGLKVGVKQCTTLREIPMPQITNNQRVRFGILVALKVHRDPEFAEWAQCWLSGKDRTAAAAERAAARAAWAAEAAERAAEGKIDFVALIKKAIRDEII